MASASAAALLAASVALIAASIAALAALSASSAAFFAVSVAAFVASVGLVVFAGSGAGAGFVIPHLEEQFAVISISTGSVANPEIR